MIIHLIFMNKVGQDDLNRKRNVGYQNRTTRACKTPSKQ